MLAAPARARSPPARKAATGNEDRRTEDGIIAVARRPRQCVLGATMRIRAMRVVAGTLSCSIAPGTTRSVPSTATPRRALTNALPARRHSTDRG
ncbi:MAG: hypothetical protein ACK4V1_09880 [Burkholderiaceae bacterium]